MECCLKQIVQTLKCGKKLDIANNNEELEIDNGFYQEFGEEGGFEKERLWIPDFTQKQPFAPGFADPLPSFLSLAGFDSVPCP